MRSADRVRAELRGFEPEFSLFLRVAMPSAFSCVPEFQIQTGLWKEWEIATSRPSRYLKSIAEIQPQRIQRSAVVGGHISVLAMACFVLVGPPLAALNPWHVASDGPTSNKTDIRPSSVFS